MKFIEEQIDEYHSRLAVFGGWVLTTYYSTVCDPTARGDQRLSQVVIPDENHEWVIEK